MKLNTTSISEDATSNSFKSATLILGNTVFSVLIRVSGHFSFALATIAILSLTTYGHLRTRKMIQKLENACL
jgi:hypothetical protein